MESPKGSPVDRLKSEDIDSKIIALDHLMKQPGWREFTEMVLYLQGLESMKLFSEKFMKLSPEDKDKEHRAIVAVNRVLDTLLHLPEWLSKRKPDRWNQVVEYLNKEANNNG